MLRQVRAVVMSRITVTLIGGTALLLRLAPALHSLR